jgi:hypothetical protein
MEGPRPHCFRDLKLAWLRSLCHIGKRLSIRATAPRIGGRSMSDTLRETGVRLNGKLPFAIHLELCVEDRDILSELEKYPDGPERDQFALEALKIGVLALRRASAALDGEFIQRETNRMIETLQERFISHSALARTQIETALKSYFDPESGHFSQRVQRLTAADGDLAKVLASLVDGDDSRLAKTLVAHFGENSPLMKQLSPDQSQGLLAVLRSIVEVQLGQHRERILCEFSLDNADGALSRMVKDLTAKHGDLSKDLQSKIDVLRKEFSLDEENSSLTRLVRNVDRAQRTITSEFSLDNEQSALRRMKTELTTILEAHVKTNAEFQEEVKVALAKLVTKREVEARGTQHGGVFEDAVFAFLAQEAQRRGDVAELTGGCVGLIPNCKVGDIVIHLGPECTAAGARIVIEAKEQAKYSLRTAHEEIERARNNRGAQHGVFVFSRQSAPLMEPLMRYGADVLVIWDAADPQTDSYLRAAIEICRALCVRCQQAADQESIDFSPIDGAINVIEKKATNLDEITTWATTIRGNSEKILERVRKDRKSLDEEVAKLRAAMHQVKLALGKDDDIVATA